MNVTQIRTELLAQHAQLRGLIEEARRAIRCVPMGEPEDDDGPAACLTRLASALRVHNLCEERMLGGVFVRWTGAGLARAEVLDERHAAEHAELYDALAITTFDPEPVGRVLDRLLEHMEYEERTLLGDDVLRDDTLAVGASGG